MTIWFEQPGELGVVVDEPQVLALGCGVGAFHVAIVHLHPLLANGRVRMVSGLAARSVIGHPLWGRANVRRVLNALGVDLVPRHGQFCALNRVYQFQHIRVGHLAGPFHILTASVPDAPVPCPPAGGQRDSIWHS